MGHGTCNTSFWIDTRSWLQASPQATKACVMDITGARPEFVNLESIRRNYPHLARALGEKWIVERLAEWPELCDYPLGRWSRMPVATEGVELINHVLAVLEHEPLIADRRRRLRSDAA